MPHSHRLRRLCFDCWKLSGNDILDLQQPPKLSLYPSLASSPTSAGRLAKARNLLCTCKEGDEWICPDCDDGGKPLEEMEDLAPWTNGERGWMKGHASSKCDCWVCGRVLGGGASGWNTPAQGGMGYAGTRGEDIWRLCMWCGKRIMVYDG